MKAQITSKRISLHRFLYMHFAWRYAAVDSLFKTREDIFCTEKYKAIFGVKYIIVRSNAILLLRLQLFYILVLNFCDACTSHTHVNFHMLSLVRVTERPPIGK